MEAGTINFCEFYVFNNEDYNFINSLINPIFSKINKNVYEIPNNDIPKIIVGWYNVKILFPDTKSLNHKIRDNLYWCPSNKDNKNDFENSVINFYKSNINKILPTNFKSYDMILNSDIENIIKNKINFDKSIFIFFNRNAFYIYNDNNNYIVNIESFKFANCEFNKFLKILLNADKTIFWSYENYKNYISTEDKKHYFTIENYFWTIHSEIIELNNLNNLLLNENDIDRFIPFLMNKIFSKDLSDIQIFSCKRQTKKDIVAEWLSKQKIYFKKEFKKDNTNSSIKFIEEKNTKYVSVNYQNRRTLTGRINAVDTNFNPQSLPKNGEERKSIISRFDDGNIALFDYISFETKLSMYFSSDKFFIDKYQHLDLHSETAKIIYNKLLISPEERKIGKDINHCILYGGGEEKLNNIISFIPNGYLKIEAVRIFLKPIFDRVIQLLQVYDEYKYVYNSFGTIIHPRKKWAIFNNYIQSTAADIMIEKICEIANYLKDKKSKFMFQVYDSFVFDIHPEERKFILNDLKKLINKINNTVFEVDVKIGKTFFDCN